MMLFTPSYDGLAEVTDKRSEYYRKCGKVIDHVMTETLDMFYLIEFSDDKGTERVLFHEKSLRKVGPKESPEYWKFFCYKDKALVAYTLDGEFEGEEEATLKSIVAEYGISANEIDIYIGTANEINLIERRFK